MMDDRDWSQRDGGQHYQELASKLGEPLLSELKGLLTQNRRIDAIKRYEDAAKVDLTTAVQVIDALGKPSQ